MKFATVYEAHFHYNEANISFPGQEDGVGGADFATPSCIMLLIRKEEMVLYSRLPPELPR